MRKQMMMAAVALAAMAAQAERTGPWPKEKAWAWYAGQPWFRGCNYMSASCANRVDQWQAYGFEERFREAEEELKIAESIGFNSVRLIVEFSVWYHEHDGFMERFERTLDQCDRHGIRAVIVLGNDCSRPRDVWSLPKMGPQTCDWGYHGGRKTSQHGSRPKEVGHTVTDEPELADRFFAMCEELMVKYAHDRRIVFWNLMNEPGANNRDQVSIANLKRVFTVAWKVDPDQPLAADLWRTYGRDDSSICEKFAAENSDIVSYHSYDPYPDHVKLVADLKRRIDRPLLCTEWLARMRDNDLFRNYPLFYLEKIGCWCWGFVAGKYQTYEPWECMWQDEESGKTGLYDFTKWFHDLYRPSHRPYDPNEIRVIREFNALADKDMAK